MSQREAMRVLMLSPFYFYLPPVERQKLIQEYCDAYNGKSKND